MRFFYMNTWTDQGTLTWASRRPPPLVFSSIVGWYLSYFISFLSFSSEDILRAILYSCLVSGQRYSVRMETRKLHTPVWSLQFFPLDNGSTWNANRKLRIHWLVFSYKQQILGKEERRAAEETLKRKWRDVCVSVFIWRQLAFLLVTHFWPEKQTKVTSSW